MAVTAADLRAEVNAGSGTTDAVLTSCLDVATELLRKYAGDDYTSIPGKVWDRALTATAVDLFNQRKAPNGVLNQQYDGESTPIRISSDPLRPAYPLLAPWLNTLGFA